MPQSSHAEGLAGQKLSLRYEIYFGGMHFVSSSIEIYQTPESYRIRAEGRSRGLFEFFIGWKGMAESAGKLTKSGTIPNFHRNEGEWRGRKRKIHLEYHPVQGPVITESYEDENSDPPETTPVDLATVKETTDPISTVLELAIRLSEDPDCRAERVIFDGRRHYRIRLENAGITRIKPNDYSSYAGQARKCHLEVERLGGFIKNPERLGRNPRNRSVFIARPSSSPLPLPVRVEVETDFGWLMIHLTGITVS